MGTLVGTLAIDGRGEVRMCSASLARLLGRPAAGVIGTPVWTLLPGWDPFRTAATGRCASLLLADRTRVPVELECHRLHLPGGALFVVEVSLLRVHRRRACMSGSGP
jgi:hypothetical protein